MTPTARAASEAALWVLGHVKTPAGGSALRNHVMVSHHLNHLRHAEGLGRAFSGEKLR